MNAVKHTSVTGWLRRNANWILLFFNLTGVVILVGASLVLYYYFVWSPEGKVPLYHAIQRTIDVYSLGRRLEEYRGKFGNYPCVADTPACDWQRELAKVNPSEPLPNDPKTGQSYVYLADESISAVAARMYRAPFTSICLKHGGETIWLVYYGGHKTASLVCGGSVGKNLLRPEPALGRPPPSPTARPDSP